VKIDEYVAALRANLAHGDATEHTHRPALKSLLEYLAKGITATNEPKRIACGAPDFIITRKNVPLGHVETKDVGTPLEEIEKGKEPHGTQFKRYIDGLPNWILTDYLDFHWFVAGERRLTARLATFDGKKKIQLLTNGEHEVTNLLEAFFKQPALTVESAKDLADRMAGMTRVVRDLIVESFQHGSAKDQKQLNNWIAAFKEVLIPDLERSQFADMFAQTLAYGLFAARVHSLNSGHPFSREMAAYNLPKTNPFLRKLFAEIAGVDMPDTFGWAVDDLVELLNHANWAKVLKDFGKGQAKHDPVVHFYETFLGAYDPKMREVRGVYYTPEPVVNYMVRSIDRLLQTHLARPKGLADEKTLILDPAVGTATFLFSVVQQIYARFAKQKGAWDGYVADHLLNRVFGFELLMAPYAVAHLKLGMELQETGYTFSSEQRLGIYLTNTLEEAAHKSQKLFAQWISDEANAAAGIKQDLPIMVVLGNPPYSVASQNKGKWIQSLLADYKEGLKEKKLNLDDDFIKFFRFAQWRIEKTGHGILGFISNNTYLDGITHRRMRQCLLETFNDIYIYNLHGSSNKEEVSPDGSKDENVFDIMIGVTIGLFIKQPDQQDCTVHYADLYGSRQVKYTTLEHENVSTTHWTELLPVAPYFFFTPKDFAYQKEYEAHLCISDEIIPAHNAGIQTKRDGLVYQFTKAELENAVNDFRDLGIEELRSKYELPADGRDWSIEDAQEDIRSGAGKLLRVLYRPFDYRWTVYSGKTKGFMAYPRSPLMWSALKDNLLLLTVRNPRRGNLDSFFIADGPVDKDSVSPYDNATFFPVYEYNVENGLQTTLISKNSKVANFSESFKNRLQHELGLKLADETGNLQTAVAPKEVAYYIYALFYSQGYRTRYAEFLKIEFARVPLTGDVKLFRKLIEKGRELAELHLMKSPKLEQYITEFPVKGSNIVEKSAYTPENNRVWINSQQYFGAVPQNVWEFHIGGYHVCERWLKDRTGRKLTYDDVQHWQRIVVAVQETMGLTKEIDALIPGWPLL